MQTSVCDTYVAQRLNRGGEAKRSEARQDSERRVCTECTSGGDKTSRDGSLVEAVRLLGWHVLMMEFYLFI